MNGEEGQGMARNGQNNRFSNGMARNGSEPRNLVGSSPFQGGFADCLTSYWSKFHKQTQKCFGLFSPLMNIVKLRYFIIVLYIYSTALIRNRMF